MTMDNLFCIQRLGYEAGSEVIELVERTTGLPCPCKTGKVCPLRPLARSTPPAPVVRVAS